MFYYDDSDNIGTCHEIYGAILTKCMQTGADKTIFLIVLDTYQEFDLMLKFKCHPE